LRIERKEILKNKKRQKKQLRRYMGIEVQMAYKVRHVMENEAMTRNWQVNKLIKLKFARHLMQDYWE